MKKLGYETVAIYAENIEKAYEALAKLDRPTMFDLGTGVSEALGCKPASEFVYIVIEKNNIAFETRYEASTNGLYFINRCFKVRDLDELKDLRCFEADLDELLSGDCEM